jgi:hypothetical protein
MASDQQHLLDVAKTWRLTPATWKFAQGDGSTTMSESLLGPACKRARRLLRSIGVSHWERQDGDG